MWQVDRAPSPRRDFQLQGRTTWLPTVEVTARMWGLEDREEESGRREALKMELEEMSRAVWRPSEGLSC